MTKKSQPWKIGRTFQAGKRAEPKFLKPKLECLWRQQRARVADAEWTLDRQGGQRGMQVCGQIGSVCLHLNFILVAIVVFSAQEWWWYNMHFRKITLAAVWTTGFGTVREWGWKKMKVAVAVVAARKDGGCYGLSCVPHDSYVEAPTPELQNVTICGDRSLKR